MGSIASKVTTAIVSLSQPIFSDIVMKVHRPTLVGFFPGVIFIKDVPIITPISPVIVINIPWSFEVATPFGGVMLMPVTLRLASTPLAFPCPSSALSKYRFV